jgi:hypothetical protein
MEHTQSDDAYLEPTSKRAWIRRNRILIALAWGVALGCLTFEAGPLAVEPANEMIAAIQIALTFLLLPGLLCAAMVGSLFSAAIINGAVQFGLGWVVLWILTRARSGRVNAVN